MDRRILVWVGNWMIGERMRLDGWANLAVVEMAIRGRNRGRIFYLAFNGDRFSKNGELDRLRKRHPEAEAEILAALKVEWERD